MRDYKLNLFNNKYSEEELENNINYFCNYDWYLISYSQNLSEEFIEKYSDKLDWDWISECQNLSEQFIRKHIGKIDIGWLVNNKYISKEIKNELSTIMDII
jgi:hypothetical protein